MISFPIIQSGKIVLQLNVSEADETWGGTAITQFVDELNENIESNDTPIIVYYEKNGYLVKGNELICFNRAVKKEDQLQYETIESALLKILESSTDALNLESGLTELGYVENPVGNEPASTRSVAGFAVNTSTCKLLEIADYLNRGYFLGGDQRDVYNALEHYLNDQELDSYEALSRPASSFLEIQQNINNCFPIAMGCTEHLLGFIPMGGHMITIIEYDVQQLIYWNSLTCKIETTLYKDGKTYIRMDGVKYKWDVSVLISL